VTASRVDEFTAEAANLRRLFLLRNILIGGQVIAVIVAVVHLKMPLPLLPITAIIAALTLFNIFTRFRAEKHRLIAAPEFFVQLLADVAAITGLLYFTGGAANPFVMVYLVPIMIAATVLPGHYTWALAVIAIILYTLLTLFHIPMQHAHSHITDFGLHVIGMWMGFLLSALLVVFFVVDMGKALRRQQRALADAREQSLRDAQLVVLGTVAASTAHELGTPLGTMALLAEELEEEGCDQTPSAREKLATLRGQIDRCKDALGTLSVSTGGVRLSGGKAIEIDRYLAQLVAGWRELHPDVRLDTRWDGTRPAPQLLADRTLTQALTNILDNAAEVSPESVECDAHWDEDHLDLEIRDQGPGLAAEFKDRAGKVPFSNKQEGLGLGLFLAHAIIERFGGTVTLFNRKSGGLRTHIALPLGGLATEHSP
jgi:two-component system sensor histidine kinase RegB